MSDTHGYRADIVESEWFPRLRTKRGHGGESVVQPELKSPRTRIFPWHMSLGGQARRSLSTPLLQGPLMIRAIEMYMSTLADPPNLTIEIGYSTVPVQEAGVPLTTARPYTVLTEMLDPFGVITDAAGAGIIVSTLPGTRVHFERTLEIILPGNSAYVVIAAVQSAIGGFPLTGTLRILEGISREAAENFL